MPTGASSSLAALLVEALRNPAALPVSGRSGGRGTAASFFEVKCAEGFKCVSKVDHFGRNHDQDFKGADAGTTVKSEFQGAYEEGCPAKGKYTSALGCVDDDRGQGSSLCWSANRFEAGKDTPCEDNDSCMCVRRTDNGAKELQHKYITRDHGSEKTMQTFIVQVPHDCESCEKHNNSAEACDKCSRCVFDDREVGGIMMKGCFDRNPNLPVKQDEPENEPGRTYLEGAKGTEKDLVVLPHYPLWDPGDKPGLTQPGDMDDTEYKFPWNSRRETLSREAWLQKFKEAAPRMQNVMDQAAGTKGSNDRGTGVKKYSPDWDTGVCRTEDLQCLSALPSRLAKIRNVRNGCLHMQEIEMRIRQGGPTEFASSVPSGKGGTIPVNCRVGDAGNCQSLNCYTTDRDVVGGIKCIREKLKDCKSAIRADDMKRKEADSGFMDDAEDEPDEPDGTPEPKVPGRNFVAPTPGSEEDPGAAAQQAMAEMDNETPQEKAEDAAILKASADAQTAPEGLETAAEAGQVASTTEAEDAAILKASAEAQAGPQGPETVAPVGQVAAPEGSIPQQGSSQVAAPESSIPQQGSLEGPVRAGLALWTAFGASAAAVRRQSGRRSRNSENAFLDFL